jgi:acyl carrier protein
MLSMNIELPKLGELPKRIFDDRLKDEIREMLVEKLMLKTTKDEILNEMPLFGPNSLGLDSIDALELVVSLEKQFGVTIPNSNIAKTALATVNSIHAFVLQHADNSNINYMGGFDYGS